MKLLSSLLTTEAGLMSAGVFHFMVSMGIHIYVRIRKLLQDNPGKTGWK